MSIYVRVAEPGRTVITKKWLGVGYLDNSALISLLCLVLTAGEAEEKSLHSTVLRGNESCGRENTDDPSSYNNHQYDSTEKMHLS